jgi:hypothetical protein
MMAEKMEKGATVWFYRAGWRTGRVVKASRQWVHVEILASDPRIKRIKKFRPAEVRLD